jgi:hypothetical protein
VRRRCRLEVRPAPGKPFAWSRVDDISSDIIWPAESQLTHMNRECDTE